MPLLKTQQDKEEFLFWIATLQSGVFEKGVQCLQLNHNSYCCLGVGVACTVPEENIHKSDFGIMDFGSPESHPSCPDWLIDISDDFGKKTGRTLVQLNDGTRLSHAQIANRLLEAYKEELS